MPFFWGLGLELKPGLGEEARIINPSIDKLQKAGISEEINTKKD